MREGQVTQGPRGGNHDPGCAHAEGDPRRQQDELEVRMLLIRHKLLVLSGKGGVGKSTVAVNLATALADAGRRVGLLDVDLHGPSVPGLLGLEYAPQPGHAGGIAPAKVSENLWAMSIQFFLPEGDAAVIWRGPRKYSAIREMLAGVDWGHLDCLVVDAPPGTGDEALALVELLGAGSRRRDRLHAAAVAVSDVRKALGFCKTLEPAGAGRDREHERLRLPALRRDHRHLPERWRREPWPPTPACRSSAASRWIRRSSQAGERGVPHVQAFAGSPTAAAFSAAIEPLLTLTERPGHRVAAVEES